MSDVLDAAAIERDSHADVSVVVGYLVEHVGAQMTAFVAGVSRVEDLEHDALNERAELRLRHAYSASRMIIEAFDERMAETWLFGSNTRLDDRAPAEVLRHATSDDELRFVVPAAKAFARASE